MAQSLSEVHVHIVFSTKYRVRIIDESIEQDLFSYLAGTCNNMECYPIRVGGHENHVHIYCTLSRKIMIMTLLEEIKTESSKWMKTKGQKYKDFRWQNGYAVFSVDVGRKKSLIKYIENQREHHEKKNGFKDELRGLLRKHQIEFDERYIWD